MTTTGEKEACFLLVCAEEEEEEADFCRKSLGVTDSLACSRLIERERELLAKMCGGRDGVRDEQWPPR